jgi:hypothetical protein
MRKIGIISLFVFFLCSASLAVPTTIGYSGVLKGNHGKPIGGEFSMTFSIYPSPDGVTTLWTETQTVTVEVGLYNVYLGSINPITPEVFDGTTRYLGIKVGADLEMTPRIPLVSVPYALRSEVTDSLSAAALQQVATQPVTVPNPLVPAGGSGIQVVVGGLAAAGVAAISELTSPDAFAIYGECSGEADAVLGRNLGLGAGVKGEGGRAGVYGIGGRGVVGYNIFYPVDENEGTYGILGRGLVLPGGYGEAQGVYGRVGQVGYGALGYHMRWPNLPEIKAGVYGNSDDGAGVYGESVGGGPGVHGKSASGVGVIAEGPGLALYVDDILRINPRSFAPSFPSEGMIYVGTPTIGAGDNHIYCYLNGDWRRLDASVVQ